MNQLLKSCKETFRELLLDFLWRQWSALGVAGHAESNGLQVIDPEALIVLTASIGRHDSRLFDEALDWMQSNSAFLNVQRLNTICKSEPFTGGRALSAIAGVLNRGTDALKWKRLAQNLQQSISPSTKVTPSNPEPFFFLFDGRPFPDYKKRDPYFLTYGFSRGPLQLRGLSRQFQPTKSPNLWLQLRALLGINARCEIILYLLSHESGHPSQIAREAYFFQKTVQDTLVDMLASGVVEYRQKGKEKHYWIKQEPWLRMLNREGKKPEWVTWPPLFSALERIWLKLSRTDFSAMDPLLASSELRQLMLEVKPDIQRAGFAKMLSDERQYLGEEYTKVFVRDLEKLMKWLIG
jgi:hypothetical protein